MNMAAAVLQSSDSGSAILSTHIHSQGKYAKYLWAELPTPIENPCLSHKMLVEGRQFPQMNGREVFKNAVVRFPEVINEALQTNDLSIDDVSLVQVAFAGADQNS